MPEYDDTLEAIFDRARREDDPDKREVYLERACGEDTTLRDGVDALLAAKDQADGFLEPVQPQGDGTAETPPPDILGSSIGPYKLLQVIGEGGFGVVYMAEQKRPVKRRVALKIIKIGMDTKQVVARFEAERQALALMDHPNIAKVLDAGATHSGRPYFVMDLVKGIPITRYCDENRLSTEERLSLFMDVCNAVQHAHQKGIIHRDIKPSNIMITLHDGVPVPKVIDFGIAKATQYELTEKTLFTQYGQMIGTPSYMSPEQAEMSGLDVNTRSDIYSLGVLLYELLTGGTPLDAKALKKSGYDEIRRRIREEEPAKPSTRVSTLIAEKLTTISTQRKIEPSKLNAVFRGDLDLIVMKSLEKDRTRRYETANAFLLDIQRYLKSEPVTAVAPSTVYRLRRFVRRNRVALATAGLVVTLFVVGSVGEYLAGHPRNQGLGAGESRSPTGSGCGK